MCCVQGSFSQSCDVFGKEALKVGINGKEQLRSHEKSKSPKVQKSKNSKVKKAKVQLRNMSSPDTRVWV